MNLINEMSKAVKMPAFWIEGAIFGAVSMAYLAALVVLAVMAGAV